jgi:hypothetical protein
MKMEDVRTDDLDGAPQIEGKPGTQRDIHPLSPAGNAEDPDTGLFLRRKPRPAPVMVDNGGGMNALASKSFQEIL